MSETHIALCNPHAEGGGPQNISLKASLPMVELRANTCVPWWVFDVKEDTLPKIAWCT